MRTPDYRQFFERATGKPSRSIIGVGELTTKNTKRVPDFPPQRGAIRQPRATPWESTYYDSSPEGATHPGSTRPKKTDQIAAKRRKRRKKRNLHLTAKHSKKFFIRIHTEGNEGNKGIACAHPMQAHCPRRNAGNLNKSAPPNKP